MRNRDRRYITLSETRAVFANIGSYTKGNGLDMFSNTTIWYAGPTLKQPIDKAKVVAANASEACCNRLGWGTNHYASPKYQIGTSRVFGSCAVFMVVCVRVHACFLAFV